jgi:hypothetical protein
MVIMLVIMAMAMAMGIGITLHRRPSHPDPDRLRNDRPPRADRHGDTY